MIYSNLYLEKKIKFPIFLLLIFFLSFFLFFSILNKTAQPSKASLIKLKRIEITNLTPVQTTIFWQTDEKITSWLMYGEVEKGITNIVLDDRDTSEKKGLYFNHYATIRNLKPDKKYNFFIMVDNKKVVKPNGSYFSFKTPKQILSLNKLSPANGKILEKNLQPLPETIVLLTVNEKIIPIFTKSKETGEWFLPLNYFYNFKDDKEELLTGKEVIKIELFNEKNGLNEKTTLTSKLEDVTKNTQILIIGRDYDLLNQEGKVLSSEDYKSNFDFQIIYPQNNALIPGKRPLIKGKAQPFSNIKIIIESKKKISANVKADSLGFWNYSLLEDLDLGKYKLTAKTINEFNKEIYLTINFTIIDNGGFEGRVLGTASGEPTILISPTPTSTYYDEPTKKVIFISPTLPTKLADTGLADLFPIFGGLSFIIMGLGILLVF